MREARSAALLIAVHVASTLWAADTDIQIGPGPATMSEEEKGIVSNPAAGEEHAVILIEEMDREENLTSRGRTTFHLRAKILSSEGRDMANVEVPYDPELQSLSKWWGRTILPDGTVHVLEESQLERQALIRIGGLERVAIKAALPGVVVGSVIDYGYKMLTYDAFLPFERIVLQREQPIRHLRYRWQPSHLLASGYFLTKAEKLDVKITRAGQSVLVEALRLPAVPEESNMPPDYEVRASVIFHYIAADEGGKDFWDRLAKRLDGELRWFCGNERDMAAAITAMGIDPAAPLQDKLGAAQRWIQEHVERVERTEQIDRVRASATLARGKADARDIDYLFACAARALGSEAWPVRVTDRRLRLLDPRWQSDRQFSGTLVAIPGLGPDGEPLVTDPSSGLPLGQVPWWFSGAPAVLATADKARTIQVRPSHAADNVNTAQVEVTFAEDNQSFHRRWTLSSTGQFPFLMDRRFRDVPTLREELAEEWCRGYAEEEVSRATLSGPTDGELKLECETDMGDTQLDDSIGRYSVHWAGPWVGSLPGLPEGPRHHGVVFEYPLVDHAHVVLHAPHGFAAAEPPDGIQLASPYGKYDWRAARTPEGFTVDRAFALLPVGVPASEYEALRAFLDEVRRADGTVLEFRRVAEGD